MSIVERQVWRLIVAYRAAMHPFYANLTGTVRDTRCEKGLAFYLLRYICSLNWTHSWYGIVTG